MKYFDKVYAWLLPIKQSLPDSSYEVSAIDCVFDHVKELEEKLNVAREALRNWLEWEDEQIKKDGAYVRPEINKLIENGKNSLKEIDEN